MDYRTVGWICDGEWAQVYKQLFGENIQDQHHALEIIEVWRVRFASKIPVAIEATYRLVETLVGSQGLSIGVKQQSYAAAILQFVGLLTEHLLKRNVMTIRSLGEAIGLPEWIINLRNTIAHGPLPSYFMLEKAVLFSLNWLKEKHWNVQAQHNSMCVQLPYMHALVGGYEHSTLDDKLFLILQGMKLSNENDADYEENVSKLRRLCKEKHAIERMCVVFVLCNYYDFVPTLLPDFDNLEHDCVPIDIVRLWKPMLNCVANSHKFPLLLYVFLHSLCDCSDFIKRYRLAVWALYLINSLCDAADFKNVILNECVKVLLPASCTDFFANVLFKNLTQTLVENDDRHQHEKLILLQDNFNPTVKQKSLPGNHSVKTLDELLKCTNSQSEEEIAESTHQLYNGASLASHSFGLIRGQSCEELAKQLYNFNKWSSHKQINKPIKIFEALDDDQSLSHGEKILDSVSEEYFDAPIEMKSDDQFGQSFSDCNPGSEEEIEESNLVCFHNLNGFDEFENEDWITIASSIDTF